MNNFETVSNEVDKRNNYEASVEFSIEWIKGSKTATVTFPGNTRYCSKIKKLAEANPNEVTIRYTNDDGSIVATIPVSYVKISAPRNNNREYTDEQKAAMAERLRMAREKKSTGK